MAGSRSNLKNPVLASGPDFGRSFYNAKEDADNISQASRAYVGKRRSAARSKRGQSANSGAIRLSRGARTFYPGDYYERMGYQQSEASVASQNGGRKVRDRFNEELGAGAEYLTPQTGGHHRNLRHLRY